MIAVTLRKLFSQHSYRLKQSRVGLWLLNNSAGHSGSVQREEWSRIIQFSYVDWNIFIEWIDHPEVLEGEHSLKQSW